MKYMLNKYYSLLLSLLILLFINNVSASGYDNSDVIIEEKSEHSYYTNLEYATDGDNETYAQFIVDGCNEDCTENSFIQFEYTFTTSYAEVNNIKFEWHIYPYDTFTPRNSTTHFSVWNYNSEVFDSKEIVTGSLSEWEKINQNVGSAYSSSSGEIKILFNSSHTDTSDSGSELALAIKEFHVQGINGEMDNLESVDLEESNKTPALSLHLVLLISIISLTFTRRN